MIDLPFGMPLIRSAAEQAADEAKEREQWIQAMVPVVKGNIALALMGYHQQLSQDQNG